ncbi:MAG TPA: LysR family transcriptional regulator [Burkholderiaceae bacterium]|nr:LysR family transcriptional regulator [Burkholderiaceae bacterium]
MSELNYHHLRYFWAIAHERGLTRAAQRLHVSQSALSVQLRRLEERLGHALFERRGRGLVLTEAGRVALDHADAIFRTGDELVGTLKGRPRAEQPVLRVGSVATLSRNFQMQWLAAVLARGDVRVVLHSGSLRELLAQLGAHSLDVVLANEAVPRDRAAGWHCRLIAEQPVAIVSRRPRGRPRPLRFPQDLHDRPMLLPGEAGSVRAAFDALLEQHDVRPRLLAEVDDMAMLRLMARETGALALVPPVVVRDELEAGTLVERCSIPQIAERFYAITGQRRFAHPLLRALLAGA